MILGHTPRLTLRSFTKADLDTFWAYRNDPQVARFQGWQFPYSKDQAIAFVREMEKAIPGTKQSWYQVALELKESGTLIGDCAFFSQPCGIQAQIGYTLARPYHQRGFGSEAVQGLLSYLFETLSMHRVCAYCDTRNEPSWKLLQKVGFRLEGHFVENYRDGGSWASEFHYGMLQREWAGKKKAFLEETNRASL